MVGSLWQQYRMLVAIEDDGKGSCACHVAKETGLIDKKNAIRTYGILPRSKWNRVNAAVSRVFYY